MPKNWNLYRYNDNAYENDNVPTIKMLTQILTINLLGKLSKHQSDLRISYFWINIDSPLEF